VIEKFIGPPVVLGHTTVPLELLTYVLIFEIAVEAA
jgi:hypothetical protein